MAGKTWYLIGVDDLRLISRAEREEEREGKMGKLVEFTSASGETVLVEMAESRGADVTTRGLDSALVLSKAGQTFEDALSRVQPAVQGVIDQMLSLAHRPDEVRVEFGLDLHAEAGAFIAAASTTANFTVTLTWQASSTTR